MTKEVEQCEDTWTEREVAYDVALFKEQARLRWNALTPEQQAEIITRQRARWSK